MAKAVVFDMNGVFVEPIELPILRRICNETRAGEWVGLSNYYLNIAQFELGYMPPKDFWKKVFPALTDEEYKEYAEAEYEKGFQRDDALYSICSVLAKECSLYCLSNSNFMQGKAYRKQKLYSPFNGIFLSHETGRLKPFPGAYTNLLAKTGLKAGECVYVDDSWRNIAAAAALGFTAVKYTSAAALGKKLKELGLMG